MAEFGHISGDPVLDLVNTVQWRLDETLREEDLSAYDRVLAWCAEAGLLTGAEADRLLRLARQHPQVAEREREAVVALREATYATLFEDAPPDPLADAARESLGRADLVPDGHGFAWRDRELTLTTPRDRVARALLDLLRRDDLDRLHRCEDAQCGWVFLDTSPRRNRRWCVTTDCGDRNRSRAYYARRRAARQEDRP